MPKWVRFSDGRWRIDWQRHKGQGVENEYETFQICSNWQEHAATTELVFAMREFCDMVKELQQDAEFR